MSREKDEQEAAAEPIKESTTTRPQAEPDPPAAKLDYQFKIVRADPKNGFDFEDVADK